MTELISATRWHAVSLLQARRRRCSPNSLDHEAANHAIDLVLSGRRPDDTFLAHNAFRDARKIVARRNRTLLERFRPLYGTAAAPQGLEVAIEIAKVVDQTYLDSLEPTPERILVHYDLYGRIRSTVATSNRYAAAVLDGWRDGDEVGQTAGKLKIQC